MHPKFFEILWYCCKSWYFSQVNQFFDVKFDQVVGRNYFIVFILSELDPYSSIKLKFSFLFRNVQYRAFTINFSEDFFCKHMSNQTFLYQSRFYFIKQNYISIFSSRKCRNMHKRMNQTNYVIFFPIKCNI